MTDLEKLTKEVADLREEVRRLNEERQTPFHYPRPMPDMDFTGWKPPPAVGWPTCPPVMCKVDYTDPRLTAAAAIDTTGWLMFQLNLPPD